MSGLAWLALGGIVLTAGDIVFKFWVEKPQAVLYAAGLATYVVGLLCLVQSYKTQNIAVASAVFVIFNIVTLLVVSWFYFNQKLDFVSLVGLVLAIAAIAILEAHAV